MGRAWCRLAEAEAWRRDQSVAELRKELARDVALSSTNPKTRAVRCDIGWFRSPQFDDWEREKREPRGRPRPGLRHGAFAYPGASSALDRARRHPSDPHYLVLDGDATHRHYGFCIFYTVPVLPETMTQRVRSLTDSERRELERRIEELERKRRGR